MCLAIAMYLITGTLGLVWQIIMALGIFLLTQLGKGILFVCASIYTVAHPRTGGSIPPTNQDSESTENLPFVTMYPELQIFEKNYNAMARESLETLTSVENFSETQSETNDSNFKKNSRRLNYIKERRESELARLRKFAERQRRASSTSTVSTSTT